VDLWLGPALTAAGASVSVAPVYYDWQAMLEHKVGTRSSIRFGFFGSDDRLALLLNGASSADPTLSGSLSTHQGFWRAQGLFKSHLTDTTELKVVGAVGQDYADFSIGDIFFHLLQTPITGRAEVSQKIDPHLTMNVGLDVIYAPYEFTGRLPPIPQAGQPPPGEFSAQPPLFQHTTGATWQPAGYIEFEATPWKGARIVPGIRLDYTDSTGSWDLDPRFVFRQDLTTAPRTTLKAAVGMFSQPPLPQDTDPVFGMRGLTSNRATHYDVGVEREFTRQINGSLDAYYKDLDHLVQTGFGNQGSGFVYGSELLLRYMPDEHFFGWLAYSLSRSERRAAPNQPLRTFAFDETHVFQVLGTYRLGRGWELGARFRLISGYMYTPEQYGFYDENLNSALGLLSYPPNGSRLPLFQSLDLRVDKIWKFKWGQMDLYLDVLNVYNAGNVDGESYNYNSTLKTWLGDLPILPSVGLHIDFGPAPYFHGHR
jgi:hypothetical protein